MCIHSPFRASCAPIAAGPVSKVCGFQHHLRMTGMVWYKSNSQLFQRLWQSKSAGPGQSRTAWALFQTVLTTFSSSFIAISRWLDFVQATLLIGKRSRFLALHRTCNKDHSPCTEDTLQSRLSRRPPPPLQPACRRYIPDRRRSEPGGYADCIHVAVRASLCACCGRHRTDPDHPQNSTDKEQVCFQ